jgi:hypothetical protein
VIAAVLLAAVVALLVILQKARPDREREGAPAERARSSSERGAALAYRRWGRQGLSDAGDSAAGPPPASLDRARRQIRLAAKPCYLAERGDPSGTIRFRYSLVLQRGQARASDLVVVASTLRSPRLEACVVEKLADAAWPAGDEEDATWTVEDRIGVTDIPL